MTIIPSNHHNLFSLSLYFSIIIIPSNHHNSLKLSLITAFTILLDFGIDPSFSENCHHQIIYSKFDFKIFYPPPYERTVCHYQQVDRELIKRSLATFDWKNALLNFNPNEKVSVLTTTVLNIVSNFIPNEIVLVNDRNPLWITSKLKSITQ